MENMIFIPKEEDFRRWIREEILSALHDFDIQNDKKVKGDKLVSRVYMAEMLDISLVTLNEWTKKGLPCYKIEGKVYYIVSEVIEYIKKKPRFILLKKKLVRKQDDLK